MSSEPLSREWFCEKASDAFVAMSDAEDSTRTCADKGADVLREAVAEALEFMAVRFEADCKADAAETLRAKAREVRDG